jgi:hypothetical protein
MRLDNALWCRKNTNPTSGFIFTYKTHKKETVKEMFLWAPEGRIQLFRFSFFSISLSHALYKNVQQNDDTTLSSRQKLQEKKCR